MTQEELSEKLNVTAQAISKWENDLSYPDLEGVNRLAAILGTTVDSILNGESKQPEVTVVETDDLGKRMMVILLQTKNGNPVSITLRLPVKLVLRAVEAGKLEELTGDNAEYIEQVVEIIKAGTVGMITDVQTENEVIRIEVVDYES